MTGDGELMTQREAARLLGVSWETLDRRREQGDPLFQPVQVDDATGRRTYSRAALIAALEAMGGES